MRLFRRRLSSGVQESHSSRYERVQEEYKRVPEFQLKESSRFLAEKEFQIQ
jgi:hypothetical protein